MAKYYSKWTHCNQGHKHQSGREARRCDELTLLEKAGKITGLEQQPRFVLQPSFHFRGELVRSICYVADFQYIEDDELVVEDCKGYKTKVYELKRKIFLFQHPDIVFRET